MPDGLYTIWGWTPLPFSEADYTAAPRRQWLSLLWGALCFGVAMACMALSSLLHREKHTAA